MRGYIRRRGKASFELTLELDAGADGKRRRRFISVKGSHRDAQRALAQALAAADAGTLPADPSTATVTAYLRAWLDGATQVSPRTLERYRELAEGQIVPHLGAIKLQRLTPEAIRAWHAALLSGGLGARTVGHAHRLLSLVLKCAVTSGTLPRNVVAIHAPPRVEEQELEILSPEQIATVLAKLAGHSLFTIVSLALSTGLRRGELLGLQFGDLDFDRATLRVERSVEETKAGLRCKAPKTKRGRRNLTLPSEAIAVLRAHKVKLLELRFALGMGPITPTTLVFSTVEGELIRPRNLTKAWSRVRAALKLPAVSFHAFRHSHASMLIRAGVDVLTISRRLGHAQASITLDVYGHLIEGADAAAAKAIEGLLK